MKLFQLKGFKQLFIDHPRAIRVLILDDLRRQFSNSVFHKYTDQPGIHAEFDEGRYTFLTVGGVSLLQFGIYLS